MRLVSLCPSLTELVFQLGGGNELVGVTEFCVHPADGVRDVEKVGGTKTPDIERIVALAPDLVLMNAEENRLEDAEALRAAGLDCSSTLPKSLSDVVSGVREVARAIGREPEGERLAAEIERKADQIQGRAQGLTTVPFAYMIWRKPWMVAAGDTYVSALFEAAGGRNVFQDREPRYPEVSAEEIAALSPMLVVLSTEPFPFDERHVKELAAMTGLSNDVFLIADGEPLSWHGSKTIKGLDLAENCVFRARRKASRRSAD